MRAPLALLMLLLIVAATAGGCGGPESGALQASREREEEQHQGEEPADADQGESQPDGEASQDDEEGSGENQEADVASGDDDLGLEESQDGEGSEGEQEGGDAGATTEVDLEQGRELFGGACAGCHTLSDAEATGAVGPNLDQTDMDAAAINTQILEGGGGMPPALLTGDDAELVAAYVAQVATGS